MRFLATAAVLLMLASPASAEGCDALVAALAKGLHTPWRSTLTLKVTGKDTKTYEVINTADKTYQKEGSGKWKAKRWDPEAAEAKLRRDWANSTCRDGGKETLDGEATNIVLHRIDTRFWISESSGLIVKTETVDRPAVLTTVYRYDDVRAPAVD